MAEAARSKTLPYLALIFGFLNIGAAAVIIRGANAPGTVAVVYRMIIGTAVLAWPVLRHVKANGQPTRRGMLLAMLGGMVFAFDLSFWSTGIMLSGATNPTLLANTAPLWVGLGAYFLFRERLTTQFWIGLIVAMCGAMLVLGLDSLQAVSLGLGSLFGLIAGVFYSIYFLITQRAREQIDALTYTGISSATSMVTLLLVNLVLGERLTGYPLQTYLLFIVLGVFVQALGWLVINYAQGHLPASIVAPTLLGQPVVTAILAWPILGEKITPLQALGGLAVMVGVYTVHRSRANS